MNQKRLWLMRRIERQNKVGRETIELQMSKEQIGLEKLWLLNILEM